MRTSVLGVGLLWVATACGGGEAGAGGAGGGDQAAAGGQSEPAAAAPAAAGPAAASKAGEQVYGNVCVVCHQANGEGMEGAFPPLAGSAVVAGDAATSIKIVLRGVSGPMTRGGVTYNGVMTPWGAQLSDEDVANVLTYVRSSWGNSAAAVTPAEVATVRAEVASHPDPYTTAELGIAK